MVMALGTTMLIHKDLTMRLRHMGSLFIFSVGGAVAEAFSNYYMQEATKDLSYLRCTTCLSRGAEHRTKPHA
jgi:hypothetical protein